MSECGTLIEIAQKGIHAYLDTSYSQGELEEGIYRNAKENVVDNLSSWLTDENISRFSPNLKRGIGDAVHAGRWADLTDAFADEIAFGTAGIRGKAALTHEELTRLKEEGVDARILKGPGTINDIVLLLKSAGVARYAAENGLQSIVIGYDSRIQGRAFATLIARLFLASGLKVYLFDEPCPYPEITFAIPTLRADLGILISASHNERRYNGYKLSSRTGAQFSLSERNRIFEQYICRVTTDDIRLIELEDAGPDQLVFLGGDTPLDGIEYFGRSLIDMHHRHTDHVKGFVMNRALLDEWASKVRVAYCAFHGAGRKAVPRLLRDFGFTDLRIVTARHLNEIDGMFPAFKEHPEQQPDPGDPAAADIAVQAFVAEYGERALEDELDVLIGTDPDADRAGIVVKVPPEQRDAYDGKSYVLLDANDAWTLLLWYRLQEEAKRNGGVVPDAERKFIVFSQTTTDALVRLALQYGLGVIKTWVGFAMIANTVQDVWEGNALPEVYEGWVRGDTSGRCHPVIYEHIDMLGRHRDINVGGLEQSNGFSILGGPPASGDLLGRNGHVRDKDGTFAALLLAEVAAYAKSVGKTIFELMDERIYLDPEIGYFHMYYEPDPTYGEYEGLHGRSKKKRILRESVALADAVRRGENVVFGGLQATAVEVYVAGKYAEIHEWPDFPDEGIRFYFDDAKVNYLQIRPSGTSQNIRFHVQLKMEPMTRDNLVGQKIEAKRLAKAIVADARGQTSALDQ